MKKQFFFAAVAIVALASCADKEYIGDSPTPNPENGTSDAIVFTSGTKAVTRGDIYGSAAAELLGQNFYVMGTKGSEADDSPTPTKVFDNYLVHYTANTAGTTTSNTANWEYVGVTPGTAPTADYIKLGDYLTGENHAGQTIKYWDYSTAQYDFFAFSTGEYKPVLYESSVVSTEDPKTIGVTAMAYGTSLKNSGTAYTFDLPSVNALKNAYITDITEVTKTNYNKEVQLQFKNLGSKVRLALYETVPGYSVQAGSVKFYKVDNDAVKSGQTGYEAPTTAAALISESTSSFASKGVMTVFFPNVGNDNSGNNNYNKAATNVTAGAGDTKMTFGTLASDKYAAAEFDETSGSLYLGRTLPTATFAGNKDAAYYETVFPVSTSYPLTLRVDYTLIATDGSGETIDIYGAKAVVPATYTKWQPNYAYTYIFKISDNTNGWTDQDKTNPGLFPITFDAVVTEATDVSGEQTTITTVATPTITTYQQGHNTKTDGSFDVPDEYDNDVEKNVYAQVMDNSTSPAKPVGATGCTLPDLTDANSLLFEVTGTDITEAKVMDALENNIGGFGTYPIEGRNNITLTKDATNITNAVVEIENGVDDNKITLTKATQGHVAAINTHALAAGTYAYVYNYQPKIDANDKNVYQLIVKTAGQAIGVSGKTRYYSITKTALGTWDDGTTATHYSTAGAPEADCLYFSITTNGTDTKTYSFVSVEGKTTIPAGLLKVSVTNPPMTLNIDGSTTASDDTFYFEKYINNDGEYAVKVIKIVE